MVLGWAQPLLLARLLVQSALHVGRVGSISTERVHVSVSVIHTTVLSGEATISGMDVGVPTTSIYLVMKGFNWTCATHLEAAGNSLESASLERLGGEVGSSIASVIKSNVGVSTSSISIVDTCSTSSCEDAHLYLSQSQLMFGKK